MPAPDRRRAGLTIAALLATVLVAGGGLFWASGRDFGRSSGPPQPTAPPSAPSESVTLRSLAAQRGISIGTAVNTVPFRTDPVYARTVAREFDTVTPESALKWSTVRPQRSTFDFAEVDEIVARAEAAGQEIRGHTLVWHRSNPAWLESGDFSRDEMITILREHITTVVSRYRGRITQWDVVNEALDDRGRPRKSVWRERIGTDYVALAFRFAHEADPSAVLYYNDVGAETSNNKADAVAELVEDLKRDGVPVHGVGFEAHLSQSFDSHRTFERALDKIAAKGLDIAITELDVRMKVDDAGHYDAVQQAQIYRDVVEMCLERERCRAVVVWGFTDASSWVPGRYPGWGAATLYDQAYSPKPAYAAVTAALTNS